MAINRLSLAIVGLIAIASIWGCKGKARLSREEIPAIKETIVAVEKVIKWRDPLYYDSIASTDAVKTAQEVFDFIYSDSLKEFIGFSQKQIVFRGDKARCDSYVYGPEGPAFAVTITLHKENEIWLFKNIEPRFDEIFGDEDTLSDGLSDR